MFKSQNWCNLGTLVNYFLLSCDYQTILFLKHFHSILLVSRSGRAYFIGKGKAPSLVAQEEKNLVGPLVTDQCTYIPYCRIGLVQKSFSNNIFHIFFYRALCQQKYLSDSEISPITDGLFSFLCNSASAFLKLCQYLRWKWIYISRKLSTAHISKLKPFSVLFSIEIVVSFKKSKQIGEETARALLLRVF